ncbi:MAG: pyruvate kinase [Phycisphaerales bacterium]|nr:pyruvate kinase [Phycisphaerales bacterium]
MSPPAGEHSPAALLDRLSAVIDGVSDADSALARRAPHLHADHRASAANLLQYLALRSHDLRTLQDGLTRLGLSSLGRVEAHVLASLRAVARNLALLAGRPAPPAPARPAPVEIDASAALLEARAAALLGPHRGRHDNRIMVTMPAEAADDRRLVAGLIRAGMDCARINAAHDGQGAWERMLANIRAAAADEGRPCRVMFDIAGPKLRTGPIEPGPQLVKYRPRIDTFGRVSAPARILVHPAGAPPAAPAGHADALLPLPGEFVARARVGDRLILTDARGKVRWMDIVASEGDTHLAEAFEGAYIAPGMLVRLQPGPPNPGTKGSAAAQTGEPVTTRVPPLPSLEQRVHVKVGDTLIITTQPIAGRPAVYDRSGTLISPALINCRQEGALAHVRPGHRVFIDDGKVGAEVILAAGEQATVRVVSARAGGENIASDKGLNFPDSPPAFRSLTPSDLADLPFIARHADLVGFSFVNTPEDIADLRARLGELGRPDLPIVLKIETRAAFERLPELLLGAMAGPSIGVMIARGDLAVEVGFERLAEVQEEILWMCQAAHVPVIWATQVLETLAKKGRPTRSEITDAAMSERAECVMLNKGPYITAAVQALDDILARMEGHQRKKAPMLRKLAVAERFVSG